MMTRNVIIFSLLTLIGSAVGLDLEYIAVVFRHGDRTPESNATESYPNDPYKDYNYGPSGFGGLTNNGKVREYMLGNSLRNRYNDFLGDLYIPKDVVAKSTDFDRTKMSLLLVLSALYPPKGAQEWHGSLNWQPIPFDYASLYNDIFLQADRCPQFAAELEKVMQLPEVQEKIGEMRPFMQELTNLTNRLVDTPAVMARLYHTLAAQDSMNLVLPSWTHPMYPNGSLFDGLMLDYNIRNYNSNIRRIFGGTVLRKIVQTMSSIANGTSKHPKINLFSAHESNIVALLSSLGLFKPHVPEYSSSIILELLRGGKEYFVKVQYYRGVPAVFEEQTILNCEDPCPLEDFIDLMSPEMPLDNQLVCKPTPN